MMRRSDDEKINNTKNPRSSGSKIQWRKDGDERDRLAKMAEGWGRYGARSGLEATHPSKKSWGKQIAKKRKKTKTPKRP